jgi:hypothetical protein
MELNCHQCGATVAIPESFRRIHLRARTIIVDDIVLHDCASALFEDGARVRAEAKALRARAQTAGRRVVTSAR